MRFLRFGMIGLGLVVAGLVVCDLRKTVWVGSFPLAVRVTSDGGRPIHRIQVLTLHSANDVTPYSRSARTPSPRNRD